MSNDAELSKEEIDALLSPSHGRSDPSREERETEELASFRDRVWHRSLKEGAPPLSEQGRREAWRVLEASIELLGDARRLGLLTVAEDLTVCREKPHDEPDFFLEWCHRVAGSGKEAGIGPEELAELVDERIASGGRDEVPVVVVSALGARALMEANPQEVLVSVARPVFAFLSSAEEAARAGTVEGARAAGRTDGTNEVHPVTVEQPPELTYDHDHLGVWRDEVPVPRQSESDPDLWYLVDTNMAFLRFDNRAGRLLDLTVLDEEIPSDLWQLRRAWNRSGVPSFAYRESEDRLYLARPSFALPGTVTARSQDEDLRDFGWYVEAWEPATSRLLWRMEAEGRPGVLEAVDGDRVRVGLDEIGVIEIADGAVVRRIPIENCGHVWDGARRWRDYSIYATSTGLLFVSADGHANHFVPFPEGRAFDVISIGVREDQILVSSYEPRVYRLSGDGEPWDGWTFTSVPRWYFIALSPEGDWAIAFTSRNRSERGTWFDRRRFFPAGYTSQTTWAVGAIVDPETMNVQYGQATTTRGMTVIPVPLRQGRFALAVSSHRGEVLHHGRYEGELSRIRRQEYALEPRYVLVGPEAELAAVYAGVHGGIRILDNDGKTIAEGGEDFALIEELFDLDADRGSVQVFGRSETAEVMIGENPRKETWRWYWRDDRWERTGFPFEGIAYSFKGEAGVFFREEAGPILVGGDPGHETKLRTDIATGSVWALGADVTRLDINTKNEERFPLHLTAYGLSWQDADALFDLVARRCWVLGGGGELLAFDMAGGDLLWHRHVPIRGVDLRNRVSMLRDAVDTGETASRGGKVLAVGCEDGFELFDAGDGTRLRRLAADATTGPLTSPAFRLGRRIYAYSGTDLVGWE